MPPGLFSASLVVPAAYIQAEAGGLEHEHLRRGVLEFASAFAWAHGGGTQGLAYEWVRFSLCLRAGLHCAHLRPAHGHAGELNAHNNTAQGGAHVHTNQHHDEVEPHR